MTMKRTLLAAMLLAAPAWAPAWAQNVTPTMPVPSPGMLDGPNRGIRPVAPAPAANVRHAASGPTTAADRDYMTRLAAQLQESITLSQAEQQSTVNPQMQRVSTHIVTSRQKELGMVNKWLARHPG